MQITSLIWIVAVIAALGAGLLNGLEPMRIVPLAGLGIIPALMGLVLSPFSNREWAQMLVILSWIALAIIACFAIAFVPMAVLFLCAPAAASLFERERVVEAMAFSAIFAGIVFYANQFGFAPEPIASADQGGWGKLAAIVATMAFMLGAMFAAAHRKPELADDKLRQKADFMDAYPGAMLRFDHEDKVQMASRLAFELFGLKNRDLGKTDVDSLFAGDETASQKLKDLVHAARENQETLAASFELIDTDVPDGISSLELNLVPGKDG
ncbi:MAG TPA: hypothetical protein ENJ42_09980, partial [Hellea balneolensis]|nr:hypothetical protein [Hellea balneolensis]